MLVEVDIMRVGSVCAVDGIGVVLRVVVIGGVGIVIGVRVGLLNVLVLAVLWLLVLLLVILPVVLSLLAAGRSWLSLL